MTALPRTLVSCSSGSSCSRSTGRIRSVESGALSALRIIEVEAARGGAGAMTVRLPTDPDGKDIAPGVSTYTFELATQVVTYAGRTFTYFDRAKAIRR